MDALEPLRAAGLTVTILVWDAEEVAWYLKTRQGCRNQGLPEPSPYFWYARVSKPPDHPTYNHPPAITQDGSPKPFDGRLSRIALHVENRQSCLWRIWEYTPGPGEHDFVCSYETLDVAVAAILRYYCGTPTLIGDWMIPSQHHPDLILDHVGASIARARWTTHARLIQHQRHHVQKAQAHWEQGRREWSVAAVRRRQYLFIDHQTDPMIQLALRRDGRAAWIIERNATLEGAPDAG